MAKHALNAFLSLQIAFTNEIARVCESVGASADDVSRALLSEDRVSPKAPLKPGPPFGGGSLQRDCRTLEQLTAQHGLYAPLLNAILPSNSGVAPPSLISSPQGQGAFPETLKGLLL